MFKIVNDSVLFALHCVMFRQPFVFAAETVGRVYRIALAFFYGGKIICLEGFAVYVKRNIVIIEIRNNPAVFNLGEGYGSNAFIYGEINLFAV